MITSTLDGLHEDWDQKSPEEQEELLKREFDRRWFMGTASPSEKAVKQMEDNPVYANFFDTPEEKKAASMSIARLIDSGGIIVTADGTIDTKAEDVLYAWDDPRTAHIFKRDIDPETGEYVYNEGWNQNMIDARGAFVAINDPGEPLMKIDDWQDAFSDGVKDAFEKGLEGDASVDHIENFIQNKADELKDESEEDEELRKAAEAYDGTDPFRDSDAIKLYEDGTPEQRQKIVEDRADVVIAKGDYSKLEGLKKGDDLFDAVYDQVGREKDDLANVMKSGGLLAGDYWEFTDIVTGTYYRDGDNIFYIPEQEPSLVKRGGANNDSYAYNIIDVTTGVASSLDPYTDVGNVQQKAAESVAETIGWTSIFS